MSGTCGNYPSSEQRPAERSRPWGRAVVAGCRLTLAAVFLMAAVTKVTDMPAFEDRLVLHTPLPVPVVLALARFLPWLELTCGACLALGHAVREAATFTAL